MCAKPPSLEYPASWHTLCYFSPGHHQQTTLPKCHLLSEAFTLLRHLFPFVEPLSQRCRQTPLRALASLG